MAAAAEAEVEGGDASAQKKKKPPIMLIAGAAAFVVIAGGAGAFFLLSGSPADTSHEAGAHVEMVRETFIFNLPPMMVNLKSDGQGEAFMKLGIALEVANEEVMTEIQPRLAKVIDAFQVYLRELRKSDLEGSAGIYRLKEELRRRVNVAIYPQQVDSILFKEILVQ